MKRTILIYGTALALLLALLKFLEYRFIIRDLSLEFYVGTVALFFSGLGVWIGWKITQKTHPDNNGPSYGETLAPEAIEKTLQNLQISPREYEVLQLIAQGYSNQEIADKLFLSLNTIKSHSSNLFSKLNVNRRTQAIQKGKNLGIIQ